MKLEKLIIVMTRREQLMIIRGMKKNGIKDAKQKK